MIEIGTEFEHQLVCRLQAATWLEIWTQKEVVDLVLADCLHTRNDDFLTMYGEHPWASVSRCLLKDAARSVLGQVGLSAAAVGHLVEAQVTLDDLRGG